MDVHGTAWKQTHLISSNWTNPYFTLHCIHAHSHQLLCWVYTFKNHVNFVLNWYRVFKFMVVTPAFLSLTFIIEKKWILNLLCTLKLGIWFSLTNSLLSWYHVTGSYIFNMRCYTWPAGQAGQCASSVTVRQHLASKDPYTLHLQNEMQIRTTYCSDYKSSLSYHTELKRFHVICC
jgi:hypothetical protein